MAIFAPSMPVDAATYTVTFLHPASFASSVGDGISGTVQVGHAYDSSGQGHAIMWSGTAASAVDLHPASGFQNSFAMAASDSGQAGYGYSTVSARDQALFWSGTAASKVNLQPSGYGANRALGLDGNTQVGNASPPGTNAVHAALWHGTAASFVDLQPSGFNESVADAVSGNTQVGYGLPTGVGHFHALMWNGTAASAVDINPATYLDSKALGVSGNSEVGWASNASTGNLHHAMLWNGSAASTVDLHPPGTWAYSEALAVYGITQVGYAVTSGPPAPFDHAMLWSGTAASAVDLHSFLTSPGLTFSSSAATGINANGTIIGYANTNQGLRAVTWTLVPEPTPLMLAALATIPFAFSRQRRHILGRSPTKTKR